MQRPNLSVAGRTSRIRFLFLYPHQIMWYPLTDILQKSVHPAKENVRRKWARADTSSMWTFIGCPMKVHKKAFMRVYERRRLRHALWSALKLNGLNKAGRRLPEAFPEGSSLMEPLVGSLQLHAAEDIENASIDDLIRDCQLMLTKIDEKRHKV
jgi:hypothetical protein